MSFCNRQFSLEDIYGHDKSDLELMTLVENSEYCINKNFVISFLTPSGQWRFSRHKNNKVLINMIDKKFNNLYTYKS